METWFAHSTKDEVLGSSLSYNDFLRSLVSISSIVYLSSSTSTKKRRKEISSDTMLIHLFVELNRHRVRFRGAEIMLRKTSPSSAVSSTKKETSSSSKKILRSIEDASIHAIRVSMSEPSGDMRKEHDVLRDFRAFLPEPVSVMPEIMLAGLRCRVYDARTRIKNRLIWSECKLLITAAHILDSTLSLSTVRRIFKRYHDESSSSPSEGLCFGSFVLFLIDISRVKYPAESKIISFQRVVAKLMGIPLHVNKNEDRVQIGHVREKRKKRQNGRVLYKKADRHESDTFLDESNLYESIVSLRREFNRFVLDSSSSSSSSMGLKNESIGLLI